ncbi:MAG TPA: hypothetical protein GXX28_03610 [Firmicutes bacterium]|nr:hypothetical protein [Bacillota bacterium]
MYYLTDELATGYLPVMDELTEALDELQDRIFARPTNETLESIFVLKRTILRLQRVIGPQREPGVAGLHPRRSGRHPAGHVLVDAPPRLDVTARCAQRGSFASRRRSAWRRVSATRT